ncbi:MAG: pteridine reductase [Burkholderiales bacterium]|nr:pteridine reductase [Burkholderiales bacterium]
MDQPLAGKAFLVTGASRRVGAAIVRRLHALGASVLIHHRGGAVQAQALRDDCNAARNGSAACVQLDLADTGALPGLVDACLRSFGRLDGLVNNASSFYPTPLGSIAEADWNALLASNLKAPLFLSQAAAPELRRTGGAIVNMIDIHADRPLRDFVVYSVAKAGLAGLTRSLALELAPAVRVNGVAPGPIEWPDAPDVAHGRIPDDERRRILATTPLGREGGEEAVVRAVTFLLTDAEFVTGQVLAVDGGRSIYL